MGGLCDPWAQVKQRKREWDRLGCGLDWIIWSSIIILDPVLVFDFHKDLFCNLMKV